MKRVLAAELLDLATQLRDLALGELERVNQLEDRDRELTDCERVILDLWNRNHPAGIPCYVADCLLCRIPDVRHFSSYHPATLPSGDKPSGAER